MDIREHDLLDAANRDGIVSHVVGLVVRQESRVLLLKRREDDYLPNMWEIPGGHVDPGETLARALARELYEETGLRLKEVLRYLGHFDYLGEFGRTREWNFEVRVHEMLRIAHPEHAACRWALPDEWAHLDMTSAMRQALERIAVPPAP